MALTPLMVKLLPLLLPKEPDRRTRALAPKAPEAQPGHSGHIIIAGYGRVGQTVVRMLELTGTPYRALDLHAQRVEQARHAGQDVYYGDASRSEVLRAAGLDEARAVVITLDQPEAAERATDAIRRLRPGLPVFARARDAGHVAELTRHGATGSVAEALESSLQLGAMLLRHLQTRGAEDVQHLVEMLRDECAATGTNVPPAHDTQVRGSAGAAPSARPAHSAPHPQASRQGAGAG